MNDSQSLPSFDTLEKSVAGSGSRRTVAIAGANDPTVLEAIAAAHEIGWISPLLVGPEAETYQVAKEVGIALNPEWVVPSETTAKTAVALVRAGRASILMKGQVPTPSLVQAILDRDVGLRTDRVIGQVVLMELPEQGRRFLMVDTGVTISPTLEQKADLLRGAVDLAHKLGCQRPHVAIMAATEKVSEAMPETGDAAALTRMALGECVVQGPLSFDLAFAAEAGDKKRIEGEVVGAADVMVFPNLVSANLTVKAIMYTANCKFGGVLVGVACPVVFMSRADSTATRLRSLVLALKMMG